MQFPAVGPGPAAAPMSHAFKDVSKPLRGREIATVPGVIDQGSQAIGQSPLLLGGRAVFLSPGDIRVQLPLLPRCDERTTAGDQPLPSLWHRRPHSDAALATEWGQAPVSSSSGRD